MQIRLRRRLIVGSFAPLLLLGALSACSQQDEEEAPTQQEGAAQQPEAMQQEQNVDATSNASSPEAAATVRMVDDLEFRPESVTIKVGETVLWRNGSALTHTVTADPEQAADPDHVNLPEGAEPFDSELIMPDQTYRRTFDTPGRYRYFCKPHEATRMIGEIIVEEPGSEEGGGAEAPGANSNDAGS